MNHLNSIRLLYLYHGFSADSFSSFDLALTKKGLKRVLDTSSRQKHPITPDLLAAIGSSLDFTSAPQAAIWALFTVAFFSFLRKSNLVAALAASFDGDRHLSHRDIKFTDSGAVLRIKWSKMRQHQEGIHIIPVPSIPHSSLCPVSALHRYFALVPASDASPFFCLPSRRGSAIVPLTTHYFTTTLKRVIAGLGLNPANYSPHSFRRGEATFAFQEGVPDHLIKLHSDWCSDAYQTYLFLPLTTQTGVADIMAASLFLDRP